MARDGGPADRQGVGDLPHRPATRAQQLDDGPPVRVSERIERVAGLATDLSISLHSRPARQPACSARCFKPLANCAKDGPRSGIERQISGTSGPVYSSRIVKRVEPFPWEDKEKVRTPL